jgi:hypothetical protein
MAEAGRSRPQAPIDLYVTHSTLPRQSPVGAVIQFLSIWTVILLIAQIACQIPRMTNEEALLMDVFAENLNYKRQTAHIILGLY